MDLRQEKVTGSAEHRRGRERGQGRGGGRERERKGRRERQRGGGVRGGGREFTQVEV